jgi:hypothetical protein
VPSEKKNPSGPLLPVSTPVALSVMLVLGVVIYSNSFDSSFHFGDAPTGQYVQARLTDIRRPTTWLLYLGAANPDYPGARQNRNYATQRLAGK